MEFQPSPIQNALIWPQFKSVRRMHNAHPPAFSEPRNLTNVDMNKTNFLTVNNMKIKLDERTIN